MDIEAIKQFVDNYCTQDNCGTRWPISYVVQEQYKEPAHDGSGDFNTFNYSQYDMYDYNSKAELIKNLVDGGYEFDTAKITENEYTQQWRDVQWFFTEAEANQYLTRNRHNLTEPRLYVKYFFRNNEAELILRTMFEIAGRDYDKEAAK